MATREEMRAARLRALGQAPDPGAPAPRAAAASAPAAAAVSAATAAAAAEASASGAPPPASLLSPDRLIVNFNDACVYERDAVKLVPGHRTADLWLNDSCINFWFRVLEANLGGAAKRIQLMDPAVMAFMRFQADEEDLEDLGPQLQGRVAIAVPVNNSSGFFGKPSTHWSLLVCYRGEADEEPVFAHYDSMQPSNSKPALATAQKLRAALGLSADGEVQVVPVTMPQQRNGTDCGVYALTVAGACR